MPGIVFRILGCPELLSGKSRHKFPSKGFQLLALLSLSRERKLTRKRAATLLWDSHEGSSALGNLRQLLVRVRRDGTADELIRSDSESVWLGPNASAIDVCAFSELTATDDVNALLQGLAGC